MPFSELNDSGQQFLLSLYKETKGDITAQKSMYEIGLDMGLDREEASKLAEDLMGWSFVEIRTLSGGIAITSTAVQEIEELGYCPDDSAGKSVQLGSDQLVSADVRSAIEQLTGEIKQTAGSLGLPFESLSELMTDLKTIDVQLDSTRPKTAILRECFRSIKPILDSAGDRENFNRIHSLLGD